MVTRRRLLTGSAALAAAVAVRPSRAAAILTDDGVYRQPWFLESFLELADDLDGATKSGKRFAIMWEQRGCPYCRETHLVNFARPDIEDYVKSNFEVLQLNLFGAREVTDFDRTKVPEKALAAKYRIRFTPTFQFFPDTPAGLGEKQPEKREVARLPGYLNPDDFLALFRFVREKAYETKSFRDYVKAARS